MNTNAQEFSSRAPDRSRPLLRCLPERKGNKAVYCRRSFVLHLLFISSCSAGPVLFSPLQIFVEFSWNWMQVVAATNDDSPRSLHNLHYLIQREDDRRSSSSIGKNGSERPCAFRVCCPGSRQNHKEISPEVQWRKGKQWIATPICFVKKGHRNAMRRRSTIILFLSWTQKSLSF